MGTERGGCSRLMKTPRHNGGAVHSRSMRAKKKDNHSQGLRDPRIKVVHSKRPAAGGSYKKIGSFVDKMVKDRDSIPEILKKWYPDMDFTNAKVYYNDFNCMFYIHARMRKRRSTGEKTDKTDKTGIEKSRFV